MFPCEPNWGIQRILLAGKHNYVFKENRKMFSLEFITKKTEICFLGNLGNSENSFRWKTEICFLLTY